MAPKPIDVVVGARLSGLRTARGVSVDRLGFALATTGKTIMDYEAGTVRVTAAHLIQICEFLDVKPSDLFPTSNRNHDPKLH